MVGQWLSPYWRWPTGGPLSQRTRSRMLAHASREMAEAAIHGRPMSGVMKKYPAAFGQATLAAMETSEQTGLIEQMADRLAKYYDRAFELEQTYRWQTFYPKLMLIAVVIIPTVPELVVGSFAKWLSLVLGTALIAVVDGFSSWEGSYTMAYFGTAITATEEGNWSAIKSLY